MAAVAARSDLSASLKAIRAVENDLEHLLSTLREFQFYVHPRGGAWSVGYCLEHLVLTGHALFLSWDSAIRDSNASTHAHGAPPYRWWHRGLLRFVEPPYQFRIRAAPQLLPNCHRPMKEAIQRFHSMHDEFTRRLEASTVADLQELWVQSPFRSRRRYRLGFCIDLVLAHERRHLWQAWQIRNRLRD